jgi:pyruvate formate-lyase/glycerol dehydratase family glycyl radical enzyme
VGITRTREHLIQRAANVVSSKSAPVWGTFEQVRTHLFDQFQNVSYLSSSGLPLEELELEVELYLGAHPDQPRVLQKANVYRIVVTRGQISIDPADWFVDKLNHGGLVRRVRDRWVAEAKAEADAREDNWFPRLEQIGAFAGYYLDLGHISPGWEKMFGLGLSGLIAEARAYRRALGEEATEEQLAFYEAVEIVYSATIELAGRFARLARQMARQMAQEEAEVYPDRAARLREIATVCERVPAHPPQTLHQALQFHWLMHELIEMDGQLVRSAGHFDRTFYPYYRADLDAGRLTREQSKELIKFFWFKHHARTQGRDNGKNFAFAGQYPDGSEVANELTALALEAYEELYTPDPKLSIRFTPTTPEWLYRRVADLIRRGYNSFVLMNDVPAVEALVKRGKTLEDARFYLPIGCYEPTVEGKEVGCTMNLTVNLVKGVELALNDGVDPLSGRQVGLRTGDPRTFTSFEQVYDAYTQQMDALLTRTFGYMRAHEATWPQVNPSPLIAATIDDCLARGRDIGQGGARYNSAGGVGAGLANVADALLAVKRVVFEEGRLSMAELLDVLASDYEGHESTRQYLLNRVPKWGNGDPEADRLARRIADQYCDRIHSFENGRGGGCQAALFTLTAQWSFGRLTGALPDGRRAHEPLAPGVGAGHGRDKNGVTALIESVTQLDFTQTPNGAVLDVMLHPSAVRGPEGLDGFVSLIRTFFARGGYAIQFNVVNPDTLRDAQRHPERYSTLQIRVTGWSVFFVELSREEQDTFIARCVHGL